MKLTEMGESSPTPSPPTEVVTPRVTSLAACSAHNQQKQRPLPLMCCVLGALLVRVSETPGVGACAPGLGGQDGPRGPSPWMLRRV